MIAWRLAKRAYSGRQAILDGRGAADGGGRWNEPGLALVYASENSSLAILETLVHTSERGLPKSLTAVRIHIPDDAGVTRVAVADLPERWYEPNNAHCVTIGSKWIRSRKSLALRVPSVANQLEENVLLNPLHDAIKQCRVDGPVAVSFDPRIASLVLVGKGIAP